MERRDEVACRKTHASSDVPRTAHLPACALGASVAHRSLDSASTRLAVPPLAQNKGGANQARALHEKVLGMFVRQRRTCSLLPCTAPSIALFSYCGYIIM